ncbi:MAG: hypothetical protein LQ338_008031 [Usnochroma carphineum]|nr:MAG: hypothetical protein LQ338_008031 [Usnochroma carphineum]
MAQTRATATRTSTRKRKRGPPAVKSPRFTNFSQAIKPTKNNENSEQTEALEANKIHEAVQSPEVTQTPGTSKAAEDTTIDKTTHSPKADKSVKANEPSKVTKCCETTDELGSNIKHPNHDADRSDASEFLTLDYEGDNSCNDNKEADASSSEDDEEQEKDNEQQDDIDNAYEAKRDVTKALLAMAHDYNSADDDEREDVEEDQKGDKNKESEAAATGMQRPGRKRLCVKAMGRVRFLGQGEDKKMEWYDPQEKEWSKSQVEIAEPAVYHQDLRELLIRDAAKLGEYPFKDYGGKRENWPEILFKYLPSRSDLMHVKPDYWYIHDGRVVVDLNDDAMYDYPELPVTLASNADPWLLLTVMRMNNTISLQDLRGRMIGDPKRDRVDPMGRNRISMNMQRFRKFACCLTWNTIRAIDTQRDYLDNKLPRRCIRQNSTKSFRMLHAWEVAELDTKDAGKYLSRTRAKNRDLSKAKSEAVYEQKVTIFQMMKKEFAKKHPEGMPNDYDTEDEEYRAQQANMQETPPGAMMGNDEPGDKSDDEVKSEPHVAPIRRRGRKKQKMEHAKPDIKHLYVLPEKDASPALGLECEKREVAQCPQRHRNYAGFLTTAPNSVTDAQLLYDLLAPTRHHFQRCTEFDAPRTEGDECYKCQHRAIENALNEWHATEGPGEEAPVCKLIGIRYVDDDMLYWNEVWNTTWYGEAPGPELLGRRQTDGVYYW